jgi:hypothetical protein
MKRFEDYLQWETEAIDRGFYVAPIAQRKICSKDFEMAFELDDESYIDYGCFNFRNNFGIICDSPEEFKSWHLR